MASTSGIQYQQQFKCKECGLALNSAESLKVHRQYHEGNLMQQWAVKAQQGGEEKNNNMTKLAAGIKREFNSNNSDSSDLHSNLKKSPDYQRNTPEVIYGHPPTPQSYQSASSPYQNNDNSAFSPNYQNYPIVKSEGNSPAAAVSANYQFSNFLEQQHFFTMDPNNYQQQDIHSSNKTLQNFRYLPYGRPQQYYETPRPAVSPSYPPQPTPSPSPKQCDKCGYVCESASQLIEHNNLTHNAQQFNQNYLFTQTPQTKEEDASQSEILDLDSHKVVHPDWANTKETDKKSSNGGSIPHSVSAMLTSWPAPANSIFQNEQHNLYNMNEAIHQIESPNFMNNNSVSSSQQNNPDLQQQQQQSYRPFEHLPTAPSSVITSTQVPPQQVPTVTPPATRTGNSKGTNWKSNEARRPKTYNCTACNKWFTSSGHLKRHYNTTLHKNAVKSSGLPDPATMPISAHHHPARDSAVSKEEINRNNSNSPPEVKSEESNQHYDNRLSSMPGLLQHPPNGPYDRQGLQIMQNPVGFSSLSNGSPPNGDAGLSSADSRGLLPMTPAASHHSSFNMIQQQPSHHMMSMEAASHHHQFQMYPNGSAPHVMQATDITTSNLNITGEQFQYVVQQQQEPDNQPLPSFAQITGNRFGGGGYADVGGLGLVTTPASMTYFTTETFDLIDSRLIVKEEESEYKLTVLNSTDEGFIITGQEPQEQLMLEQQQFSPTTSSNNNNDSNFMNNDTYISSEASQPLQEPLSISTTEEESKENFEQGNEAATGSPSISSTSQNDEDLSKTKCFDCDKVFNRPCYLTQHNRTCHNGEKPYKCSRCGKRFADMVIFEEHTGKHAGDKPHKCDTCPKMFNHKTDLRRHICCHTGKKPYACAICGKGFIRKDHMVKHVDTHSRKKQKSRAMRS